MWRCMSAFLRTAQKFRASQFPDIPNLQCAFDLNVTYVKATLPSTLAVYHRYDDKLFKKMICRNKAWNPILSVVDHHEM